MVLVAILSLLFTSISPLIHPSNTQKISIPEFSSFRTHDRTKGTHYSGDDYPNPVWNKTYADSWASSIKVYEGYTYVAGSFNYLPKSENDILLMKYDMNGNLIWSKKYDEYPYDAAWAMDIHDGYIYIAGFGSDWRSAITYSSIMVLKYDMNGNLIWSKKYDEGTYNFAYSIVADEESIYVGGQIDYSSLLLKYDTDGNLIWEKIFSNKGEMYSEMTSLDIYNGWIYGVGETENENGDDDILVIKYDNDGNIIWNRTWEKTGTQEAYGLDVEEGIYICGFGDVESNDGTGIILKYGEDGEFEWYTSFQHFKLEDIKVAESICVVGESCTASASPDSWDIVIAQFGKNGGLITYNSIYNSGCDIARGMDMAEENIYVAGSQGDDALILKFESHFVEKKIVEDDFKNEKLSSITFSDIKKLMNTNKFKSLSKSDSIDIITGAADWLVSLAEPTSSGYKWPLNEEEKEYYTDLMDGTPGVSLFLLKVYEITKNQKYLQYAKGGMEWMMSIAIPSRGGYEWPETQNSPSFYVGAAGIGEVFLDFYQSLGDTKYLQYAEGAAHWIESVDGIRSEGWGYDIISGSAGIGIFFLHLYDVTGNTEYLFYAKKGGDWLISSSRNCPILFLTEKGNPLCGSSAIKDGCLWIAIPLYWITSAGFGHGTAGVVYFLAELYKRCGEEKYVEYAEKAAKWIIHESIIEGNGDMEWRWKYRLDQLDSPFYYNTGWCYGNAGIGKAFISLYQATKNPYYFHILENSTNWLIEQAISDGEGYRWIIRVPRVEPEYGYSVAQQCHGVSGVGDFFLDLYNLTGNFLYLEYGIGAVRWLENSAIRVPYGYKWDAASDDTGYSFGEAGIGLFLARAYETNFPPFKPDKPSGPPSGKIGREYVYTSTAVDANGDKVRYGWDWDGDGIVDEWTPYYASGESIEISHSWNEKGTYQVRVKAEDEHGAESLWSDPLTVSMPKTYESMLWVLLEKIYGEVLKILAENY